MSENTFDQFTKQTRKRRTPDMSKAAFDAELQRRGFSSERFLGYYRLPAPCDNTSVSKFNGGNTRRGQLAYLVNEYDRIVKQLESKEQS